MLKQHDIGLDEIKQRAPGAQVHLKFIHAGKTLPRQQVGITGKRRLVSGQRNLLEGRLQAGDRHIAHHGRDAIQLSCRQKNLMTELQRHRNGQAQMAQMTEVRAQFPDAQDTGHRSCAQY